ncbi:MAG: hypothetical protein LBU16_10695 [Treponema sp.]|jgi:hypothetical protein|nr:hypothetical protein [Treponema sp.]
MRQEFKLWMKIIGGFKDNTINLYEFKIDKISIGQGIDILEENDIQLINNIYNVTGGGPELKSYLRFLY